VAAKSDKKEKARRETPLQIRLTEEEKAMFLEAAGRDHLSLSAWLRLAGIHAIENRHKLAG
jgi:uncharacterized protein (DUF1778 family)